nr:unnamed protein product [Spirometra erinaceieuropaei]
MSSSRGENKGDVLVTKAIPGAGGGTEHRLIIPRCGFSYGLAEDLKVSAPGNELAQRLSNLPVAAAADENASAENRWCQLQQTVQSTALTVLGHALRKRQDWFDDNDSAINNLLVKKNRLHKAYVDRPTDDIKAAFCRSRSLAQQQFHEMQDA